MVQMLYKNIKFPIILAEILIFSASLHAQEKSDSTISEHKEQNVKDLNEVVVEGDREWISANKSTYIPTTRQKKAAQDATDLLMRMAIPELMINPLDRIVKTGSGEMASIFIDYVPARQEDLAGLKTTDVKRVDFYTASDDPRFGGAFNVINFVLNKYEFGGYTKLSGEVTTNSFDGSSLYNAESLYSKFSYRKMTYDLYAGVTNSRNTQARDISLYIYRIPDKAGSITVYSMESECTDKKYLVNTFPVTFRASYSGAKFQFQTSAGYTYDFIPASDLGGVQTIDYNGNRTDGSYYSRSNGKRHNLTWDANATANLPAGFSLNANLRLRVAFRDIRRLYSTTENLRLDNSYNENHISPSVHLNLSKKFGMKHTLSLNLSYGFTHNNVTYTEADASDYNCNYLAPTLDYVFFSDKWLAYASTGLSYENNLVGSERNIICLPHFQTHVSFSPNDKNGIRFQARYGTYTPALNSNSNTILRTSEFLYVTGNPGIRDTKYADLFLNYTFLPAAWLRGSVYAMGNWLFDRPVTLYAPYDSPDGNPALLRYLTNNGMFREFKAGANLSSNLFNNSLVLGLNPEYRFCNSSGSLPFSFNSFRMGMNAYWYFGSFYVSAYGSLPTVQISQDGTKTREKGFYCVSAGWSNGNVQLSLIISNFANWKWDGGNITSYNSTYYDSWSQSFSNGSRHADFRFKMAWTIGYGKKIRRSDEIGVQSSIESGAL